VLNQDFKEFVRLLNEYKVEYLVVGGYAVAFHGYPRYTKDMDIWINRNAINANRILSALDAFGFGDLDLTEEDFLNEDHIIQLGYPPARIDIITGLEGVDFEDCYTSKVTERIDDIDIKFIDLESLRKNKKATGRIQDLADLEHLA